MLCKPGGQMFVAAFAQMMAVPLGKADGFETCEEGSE